MMQDFLGNCLKQDERILGKLSEAGLKDSRNFKMLGYVSS